MNLKHVVTLSCSAVLAVSMFACTGGSSSSSSSSSSGSSSGATGGSSGAGGSSSSAASGSSSTGGNSQGGSSQGGASSGGTSGGAAGLGDICTPSGTGQCATVTGGGTPACLVREQAATQGFCAAATTCTVGTACLGAGTRCIALTGGSTACVRSCDATGADGQCGADKGCGAAGDTSGNYGLCLPLALAECVAGNPARACTGGATCTETGTDGYGDCTAGCDILAATNSCTGQGEGCFPSPGAPTATTGVCFGSNNKALNAACTYLNDCAPGLICGGTTPQNGKCSKPCNSTHACTTGTCSSTDALLGYCAVQ